MERFLNEKLKNWKNQATRKPFLLKGARQVGKTWLLENFGKLNYKKYLLFDFTESKELYQIFENNLSPLELIRDLSVFIKEDIDLTNTLIIFDEIQKCPNALTSLKYFYKHYPTAYICATGSLLGVGLTKQDFPVGKVDTLWLYPMCFFEFLLGIGEDYLFHSLQKLESWKSISRVLHKQTFDVFKQYLITGGMPEVILQYSQMKESPVAAYRQVRNLQNQLISSYFDDFAKHSGNIKAVKIEAVFKNVPLQLAREDKTVSKFTFKDVLARDSNYSNLQGPIEWLVKAGLIHKTPICKKAEHPLITFTDHNVFKLYFFDVGLLGAAVYLPPEVIHNYDFGTYKGYLAENFVLTEMIASGNEPLFGWREKTSEIEFLFVHGKNIIPIEVKAGINTKAKSLKIYKEKYNPARSVLLSGTNVHFNSENHLNLPLYLSCLLSKYLCK